MHINVNFNLQRAQRVQNLNFSSFKFASTLILTWLCLVSSLVFILLGSIKRIINMDVNMDTSEALILPQKKFYRQRAHSNPIADHCID